MPNSDEELSASFWDGCEPDAAPEPVASQAPPPDVMRYVVGPSGHRSFDLSLIHDEKRRATLLKNRVSAARSRQRYIDRINAAQRRVRELEVEVATLRARICELEAENRALRARVFEGASGGST